MRHPNIDSSMWRKYNSDLMIIATMNIFWGTESTIHQNRYLFIQTFLLYVCPHFLWMVRSTDILDKNRFVKRSTNSIMDCRKKIHKFLASMYMLHMFRKDGMSQWFSSAYENKTKISYFKIDEQILDSMECCPNKQIKLYRSKSVAIPFSHSLFGQIVLHPDVASK